MGVSLKRVSEFFGAGYLTTKGARVLDIGCSNLNHAEPGPVVDFVRAHNDVYDPASLRRWADYVAAGSVYDYRWGAMKGAWLGDLLMRAGMEYVAFDIFPGFRTEFLDMNTEDLPQRHRGAFEVVFNFGTTEHVLNQWNSFKIIHEALAVGGVAYHDVPMLGYIDHGYFNYNPVMFTALAEANGYEILKMGPSDPAEEEEIEETLIKPYRNVPFFEVGSGPPGGWKGLKLPHASLSVILRKTEDRPFRAALETSTTVGGVVGDIAERYDGSGTGSQKELHQARTRAMIRALLFRCGSGNVPLEEIAHAYDEYQAADLREPFPMSLERRSLELWLERNPDDEALKQRIKEVDELMPQRFPLLPHAQALPADGEESPTLAFDGVEEDFPVTGSPDEILQRVLRAYRAYADKVAVELFPARLENIGLRILGERTRDIEEDDESLDLLTRQARTRAMLRDMLFRCKQRLTVEELDRAYQRYLKAGLSEPFPLSLEMKALRGWLELEPENQQVRTRLAEVEELMPQRFPLLRRTKSIARSPAVDQSLKFDGVEPDFTTSGSDQTVMRRVLAAYKAYQEELAVELFPARLEAAALEIEFRKDWDDFALLVRLGELMRIVTPEMPIERRVPA